MNGHVPEKAHTEVTMEKVGRRHAMRQMFHREHLKGSVELRPQVSLRNSSLAGLQAALTAAIALPLVQLSQWSHLIGFAALGVLVALFARFAPRKRRTTTILYCALTQTLAVFSMSTAVSLGATREMQLVMLALSCGLFVFVSLTGKFGAPGPLIFVFASSAAMTSSLTMAQVVERTAAVAIVSALAWVICAATESFRHYSTEGRPIPAEPDMPMPLRLKVSMRNLAGAGLSIFIAVASGTKYPGWAAMGTLAVMMGSQLHISMDRAIQRTVGTLLGAALAWLALSLHPTPWTVIAALIFLQFATEIIIGVNYALGMVFVTPMALLITYLGAGQLIGPELAPERVLDTMLGVAVGVILSVLLSTVNEREHLAARRIAQNR